MPTRLTTLGQEVLPAGPLTMRILRTGGAIILLTLFLTPHLAAHEPPPDPGARLDRAAPSSPPLPHLDAVDDRDSGAPDSPRVQNVSAAVSGTPLYTHKVTNNIRHEVESAIVALTVKGVDRTIGGYMREANGIWRIQTVSTNQPANSGLFHWTRNTPALPSGHRESVDPVLDINHSTLGVGPERTYLGGLTYDLEPDNDRTFPEAVVVWRSDDGGVSWMNPVTVDSHATGGSGSLDKPDIAVSWYPSTRGYLYVAYVNVIFDNATRTFQNELFVKRSTNGGASFGSAVQLATGYVQAPQVVVSSDTGKVYVLWVDLQAQQLRLASSNWWNFTTWTQQASLNGVGRFLEPGDTIRPGATHCTRGVQAVTVPHARFNWVKDQIGVVWHERETATSQNTDVFFSAFTASGWLTPRRVNPVQAQDQWYPALDYDTTGDYLVVYYDRRLDSNNLLYREAWARINSVGTRTASGFVAGAFDSNPTEVYNNTSQTLCFKGEYQDVWFWPYTDANGPRFHSFWTGHPSTETEDEAYLSAVK